MYTSFHVDIIAQITKICPILNFQNEKAPVNRIFTVSDAFHSMRKKRLELSQD